MERDAFERAAALVCWQQCTGSYRQQKYGGGGYEYPREGTRANTEPTYEYEYPREGTRANTEPTYGYDRSKTGNAGKQQKHASVLGLSELSRD